MRSNIELLQLLLDNKQYFRTGLCMLTYSLKFNHYIISWDEYQYLITYIEENSHTLRKLLGKKFYWKPYKWKPREKWINNQIKKHERNNNNIL